MITEKPAPGRPGQVIRYHCPLCGENWDAIRIRDTDKVDHHCRTLTNGPWWILRRAA